MELVPFWGISCLWQDVEVQADSGVSVTELCGFGTGAINPIFPWTWLCRPLTGAILAPLSRVPAAPSYWFLVAPPCPGLGGIQDRLSCVALEWGPLPPPFPKSQLRKEAHDPSDVLDDPSSTLSLPEPGPGRTGNLRAHVNLFSRQFSLFPNSEKSVLFWFGFLPIFIYYFIFQCKMGRLAR